MQLFIVSENKLKIEGERIRIDDQRVVLQVSRVLRAKLWYICSVQMTSGETTYRRRVCMDEIEKTHIAGKIEQEESKNIALHTAFVVPLPNKREKLELVLQKLTEIGIDEIILRPAERSQLKMQVISSAKLERRHAIMLEAAEQSRRRSVPSLRTISSLQDMSASYILTVFDIPQQESEDIPEWEHQPAALDMSSRDNMLYCGLVWPEWWLSDKDYASLTIPYTLKSLGTTVLRMETAAIIWAWSIVSS